MRKGNTTTRQAINRARFWRRRRETEKTLCAHATLLKNGEPGKNVLLVAQFKILRLVHSFGNPSISCRFGGAPQREHPLRVRCRVMINRVDHAHKCARTSWIWQKTSNSIPRSRNASAAPERCRCYPASNDAPRSGAAQPRRSSSRGLEPVRPVRKRIAVFNVDGGFFALGNMCTHRGTSLAEGTIAGCEVICPCHGATYAIKTGEVLAPPAPRGVARYGIRVTGPDIAVEV